jgi:ketosteroid isomerase-like protein
MRKLVSLLLLWSIPQVVVLSQATANRDLASLVAAERAFAKMGAEKGLREAFLAYFADDGINFQPHPKKTKEFILSQTRWGTAPILVEWEPTFADVAQAGDLGYTTGPVTMIDQSPQKRPTRYGTYFSIWKKQADRSWKVVLDAGTDGPVGATPQTSVFKSTHPSLWKSSTKLSLGAARASLMDLDRALLSSAEAKGLTDTFLASLADEARLHRSGHFPFIGKEAIRGFLSQKEVDLSWQPISSDVSQSEDLGYSYGSYKSKQLKTNEIEEGYYVRVWKRDRQGDWKVVLDTHSPVPTQSKEAKMNSVGYQLLQEKKIKEAIEVFKNVVAEFPNSANAYDSLADAYEADGNKELAIEFAQKALDMLARDANGDQEFKNRVRESANDKLKRLKGQ